MGNRRGLPRSGLMFQAAVVLALSLAAVPARGQEDDEAIAKKHFDLGRSLYRHSDYEGAITEFRAAYRLSRRPALLFNIARSHEALGQLSQAIEVYREYLRTRPPDAGEVQARIANLQAIVDKQRAAEQERARREAMPRGGSKWPGWITVGAGATVAVLGGVFMGLAKVRQSDAEQAFKSGQEYTSIQSAERQGRTYGIVGPLLLGVGGAAVVTGGVLLVLHYRRHKTMERAAWLTPVVAPGGVALMAGGRF